MRALRRRRRLRHLDLRRALLGHGHEWRARSHGLLSGAGLGRRGAAEERTLVTRRRRDAHGEGPRRDARPDGKSSSCTGSSPRNAGRRSRRSNACLRIVDALEGHPQYGVRTSCRPDSDEAGGHDRVRTPGAARADRRRGGALDLAGGGRARSRRDASVFCCRPDSTRCPSRAAGSKQAPNAPARSASEPARSVPLLGFQRRGSSPASGSGVASATRRLSCQALTGAPTGSAGCGQG